MTTPNVIAIAHEFRSSALQFSCINDEQQTIVGRLWTSKTGLNTRLVLVVHGLGGSQNQPQIEAAAEAFYNCGCNVLAYDATNSFGSSGGNIERASLTAHAADLNAVMRWVRTELGFTDRIVVCGFSLGASAAFVQSIKYPGSIDSTMAFAPVVSGRDWLSAFERNRPGSFHILEATGAFPKYDDVSNRSGSIRAEFVTDLLQYDFVRDASALTVPIYLIVGNQDQTCPPASVNRLKSALGNYARLKILDGFGHTARTPQELRNIREFLAAEVTVRKVKARWLSPVVTNKIKAG